MCSNLEWPSHFDNLKKIPTVFVLHLGTYLLVYKERIPQEVCERLERKLIDKVL